MYYYFIYETKNLINGKLYRGMHMTKDLDDGYLGSGTTFKHAIKKYGKDNFERTILEHCNSFEELAEREEFYVNEEWIKRKDTYNLKTGGQKKTLYSEESKKKIAETLSKTLKEMYANGYVNPLYGKKLSESHIANMKKYRATEETKMKLRGRKKSEEEIAKLKKYKASDDAKRKISIAMLERYKTQEHPSKGKPSWNKGLKGAQSWSEESKNKVSESLLKYYETNESKNLGKSAWNSGKTGLQTAWNKGVSLPKQNCPHCGKAADASNLKRWHLDNCKMKPKD